MKTITHRFSKAAHKTHVVVSGASGTQILGRDSARAALRAQIGGERMRGVRESDTPGQWTFRETFDPRMKSSRVGRLARRAKRRDAIEAATTAANTASYALDGPIQPKDEDRPQLLSALADANDALKAARALPNK